MAINESKRLLCSPWRKTEPLDGCETQALPSAAHQELLDAVLRLKPKYRTVIYLHYYEGLSTQEIASVLGTGSEGSRCHFPDPSAFPSFPLPCSRQKQGW